MRLAREFSVVRGLYPEFCRPGNPVRGAAVLPVNRVRAENLRSGNYEISGRRRTADGLSLTKLGSQALPYVEISIGTCLICGESAARPNLEYWL